MSDRRHLWGTLTLRILDALEQLGPMTTSDLASHLGISRDLGAVMSRLKRATKTTRKRVYVADWRRDQVGQKHYPRPVYAFGDKRDKPRPSAKARADVVREYMQNAQARMQSVQPGISQVAARKLAARASGAGRNCWASAKASKGEKDGMER